jgi:hypothetical protein
MMNHKPSRAIQFAERKIWQKLLDNEPVERVVQFASPSARVAEAWITRQTAKPFASTKYRNQLWLLPKAPNKASAYRALASEKKYR